MNDDYLWDRAGKPDPDVERLEDILGVLAYHPRKFDADGRTPRRRTPVPSPGQWVSLAVAATMILAAVGVVWWLRDQPQTNASIQKAGGDWTAEPLQGLPTIGSKILTPSGRMAAGDWLETDEGSRVRLHGANVGLVEVGPQSRVRLVASREGQHRFQLERGVVHASIWAPPGQFFVDTPSATAVDLGCSYSLAVSESGAGTLRVTSGWVGLERGGSRAFVPAGASCRLLPGKGPGTPMFDDARERFALALDMIDSGSDLSALAALLSEARPRDAMTLWHLLERLDGNAAAIVYDRLAALAPPPPAVSRERILARDRAELDAWWNSFGLGDAGLFRQFTGGGL